MAGFKMHGITSNTPEYLMFNAAALFKNVPLTTAGWTEEALAQLAPLAATSGGCKIAIENEYIYPEIDGATVNVKGLTQKMADKISVEANFTEFIGERLVDALHLVKATEFSPTGYDAYTSKAKLTAEDYIDNLAVVGTLTSGKQMVFILPAALCTSALELETKNKEQATYACKFEGHAPIDAADLTHIPYYILTPTATA